MYKEQINLGIQKTFVSTNRIAVKLNVYKYDCMCNKL